MTSLRNKASYAEPSGHEPGGVSSYVPSRLDTQTRWVLLIIFLSALGILALCFVALLARNSDRADINTYVPALRSHDPVVARVNDSLIYVSDVVWLAQSRGLIESGVELGAQSPLFNTLREELIDRRMLAQEGQAKRLQDQPEIRHRLQIANERILSDAMIGTVVEGANTEAALRRAYVKVTEQQKYGQQARVRQIVVPDEETAGYVVKLLGQGQSFSALATAYSTDRASRENGGDLGYISRDMLDPALTKIAFLAKVDEISKPFKTDQGWHVLQVLDRRVAPKPDFETMKEDLARLVEAEALDTRLQSLREHNTIIRMDENQISPLKSEPNLNFPLDKDKLEDGSIKKSE